MFTLWELQFKVANSLEIIFFRSQAGRAADSETLKHKRLLGTWDCANLQGYRALLD